MKFLQKNRYDNKANLYLSIEETLVEFIYNPPFMRTNNIAVKKKREAKNKII